MDNFQTTIAIIITVCGLFSIFFPKTAYKLIYFGRDIKNYDKKRITIAGIIFTLLGILLIFI